MQKVGDSEMRPAKLSSNLFLELPPILAHYVEAERHLWVEGNPKRGRLSVLNRSGGFMDHETLAVERRHLIATLGVERARALLYRVGFEQGRRDAARHFQVFGENARLALQAALVFGQLQGRYVAETRRFDYDADKKTLLREIVVSMSSEAAVQRMAGLGSKGEGACWNTAGYFAGHTSEILGKRVLTMESGCSACGAEQCAYTSKLDAEFGEEANWIRAALQGESVDEEVRMRDALVSSAQKAARRAQMALTGLNRRLRSDLVLETVVADSEAMAPVAQRARQLMASDAPVIIHGEPGTGKETIARTIHNGSPRKKKPFVEVDCVGLTDSLLEQELFGFEKDAFPGATLKHTGAYLRANGGTLYLNRVTALSHEMQGLLLKAIQTGQIWPKGAEKPEHADVRVIAAVQEDPLEAKEAGEIREDFYYALAVGRLDVPPLRERQTDILRLAEDFLRDFQKKYERPQVSMSAAFKQVLLDCAWPANVRQLRNVIEHAVIMSSGGELEPKDLPEEVLATRWMKQPGDLTPEVIKATLSRTNNNRSKAAEMLGVGRTTLWRSMKRYGIE
jgi:two-component system response regulator HydG